MATAAVVSNKVATVMPALIGKMVIACARAPTKTVELPQLATDVQWSAMEKCAAVPKSMKKFLKLTNALVVYDHSGREYAAVPWRESPLSTDVDLAAAADIVTRLRLSPAGIVQLTDHERTSLIPVSWLLRREFVMSSDVETTTATKGERQVIQESLLSSSAFDRAAYVDQCVAPLLHELANIFSEVPLSQLEVLLSWSKLWGSLPKAVSLEERTTDDGATTLVVLNPTKVSKDVLPSEYVDCAVRARTASANEALDHLALVIHVVFEQMVGLLIQAPKTMTALEDKLRWGLYRYRLGTFASFVDQFTDVFFFVDGVLVSLVRPVNVTASLLLARLVVPVLEEGPLLLPALYAATKWTKYFQARYGLLQSCLTVIGYDVRVYNDETVVVQADRTQPKVNMNASLVGPVIHKRLLLAQEHIVRASLTYL